MNPQRRRRFWGWGWEGEGPAPEQQQAIARLLAARFALPEVQSVEPPRLEELRFPAPRLRPPAALAAISSETPYDRAAHTHGKSFRDVVRALRRD
ncbi:MAG: FAD-binding oxidoreductase, partial [Deltaproteobacteria bacterium]